MLLMRVGDVEPDSNAAGSRKSSFGEGVAFVISRPVIVAMMALLVLPVVLVAPFVHALLPVYASGVYGVGPAGLGLLTSALGAGSTLGIMVLACCGGIRNHLRVVILTLTLAVLAMAGFSLSPSLALSLPLLMLLSAGLSTSTTLGGAATQSLSPGRMRGRVSSICEMTGGLFPLGALASGALAQLLGAPSATLIASGGMLAVLVAVAFAFRGIWWHGGAPAATAPTE